MQLVIEVKQVIGEEASAINSIFGSNLHHWHPEYRLWVDGKRVTGWVSCGFDDSWCRKLASEAQEAGHKVFPDQIRKVWDRHVKQILEAAEKDAAREFRAECAKKGEKVNLKRLKKAKRQGRMRHFDWWMSSGGSCNSRYKNVKVGP